MVGLTVAVVSTIAVTGGGAALIAGAGAGAGCGALGVGAAEVATVGSAIGSGMSAGAIAGAAVSTGGTAAATYTGAGIGAVAGGISGGAVSGSGIGIGAILAGSTGFGAILVGASDDVNRNVVTYDCWKPVIKDKSMEPSKGILMKDLLSHPNVSKVTATTGHHSDLPNIVIKNIWNELFEIEYLWLHTPDNIVCHAKLIS